MSKELKLQEYFKFTPNDLHENQQGRITENQRTHVKGKVQRFNSRILVFMALLLILSVGAFFVVRVASAGAGGGSSGFPASAILGPGLTVVILIVFMVSRTNRKNDLSIQKAEGVVNFAWVEHQVMNQDRTGYKTEKSLQMRVGGASFNVNEKLMDIINQGDNVRFYYTGGGDIVSAEFVDSM